MEDRGLLVEHVRVGNPQIREHVIVDGEVSAHVVRQSRFRPALAVEHVDRVLLQREDTVSMAAVSPT